MQHSHKATCEEKTANKFTLWCYDIFCEVVPLIAEPLCPRQLIVHRELDNVLCICCVAPLFVLQKQKRYRDPGDQ